MSTLARLVVPAVVLLCGCAEQPTDPSGLVPVQPGQVPPIPVDLSVEVSQGDVILRWNVADATGVTGYRVYRAVGSGSFEAVGVPPSTIFTDDQVVSGTRYRY